MPLARWRTHRERERQKRKVLQMLALSGVVRPSHIEFRYTVPILKVGDVNRLSSPETHCSQETICLDRRIVRSSKGMGKPTTPRAMPTAPSQEGS